MPLTEILEFLGRGGPVLWLIAVLSVLALALILWKVLHFLRLGAFGRDGQTDAAIAIWCAGQQDQAIADLAGLTRLRARLAHTAMAAAADAVLTAADGREEATRIARNLLAQARTGLRPLELIVTVAPLLGLLGTVLGMIEAFQVLQEAGNRADPAALAGGIWEALLTTAAGMAVAIPASMALSWFDGVVERAQTDMEDAATRIFLMRAA